MLSRVPVEKSRAYGRADKPAAGSDYWAAPPTGIADDLGSAAAVRGASDFVCAVDDLGFVHAFHPSAGLRLGGPAQLHRDDGNAELADRVRQPVAVRLRLRAAQRSDRPNARDPARPAHPRREPTAIDLPLPPGR